MQNFLALMLTLALLQHSALANDAYTGLSEIPSVDEYCLAAQRTAKGVYPAILRAPQPYLLLQEVRRLHRSCARTNRQG